MNAIDFFNAVEDHEELAGLGMDTERGIFAIEHKPTKITTCIHLDVVSEPKVVWDTLESILVGKREPDVLYHMTRVVGYFSRVSNFNSSKVAELADRQKGNYAI